MHELSITQDIVRIVLDHAAENKAARVLAVHLVVGELNGIVPESVEFYFEHVAAGTAAEGARVHFEMVPAQARCPACNETFVLEPYQWQCPKCGSLGLDVIAGKELSIASIDVE